MKNSYLFTLLLVAGINLIGYSQCQEAKITRGTKYTCGDTLNYGGNTPLAGYTASWKTLSAGLEIITTNAENQYVDIRNKNGGKLVYTLSNLSSGCVSSDTAEIVKAEIFSIIGASDACPNYDSIVYGVMLSDEVRFNNPSYKWEVNGTVRSTLTYMTTSIDINDLIVFTADIPNCGVFRDSIRIGKGYVDYPSVTFRAGMEAFICEGDSMILKPDITGAGKNPEIKWYRDDVLIAEDSLSLTLGRGLTPDNTYRIIVEVMPVERCYEKVQGTAEFLLHVGDNLNNVIISSPDTLFCPGKEAALFISGTSFSEVLKWYRNGLLIDSSQYFYSTKLPGTYRLNASNLYGCSGWSNTLVIDTLHYDKPIISASPGKYVCEGGKTLLKLMPEKFENWYYNNERINDYPVYAQAPGWYKVQYEETDAYNCRSSDSVYLESRPFTEDSIILNVVWFGPDQLEIRAQNLERPGTSIWEIIRGGAMQQVNDSLVKILNVYDGLNSFSLTSETTCGPVTKSVVIDGSSKELYDMTGTEVINPGENYTFYTSCIPGAKYEWSVPAGFQVNWGADSCVINISAISTSALRTPFNENDLCVVRTEKEPAVICKTLNIITSATRESYHRFTLAPNPFNSTFEVKNLGDGEDFNVRIIDQSGKIAENHKLINGISYGENLPEGFYLIQIYNKDSIHNYKLLKN